MNNLALLLSETGDVNEAEALYREALAIRRQVFGDEHPAVATGLKNLALLLMRREAFADAEALYREALAIGRRLPGNEHHLANTLNNFAALLATLGRYDEAEPLCREGLAIREAKGPDHPRRARSLLVLGRIRLGKSDPAGAEPLLREALDVYRRRLPAGHRAIARALSELGGAVLAQRQLEEAETLLLESSAIIDRATFEDAALERDTLARLVELYEAWGMSERAAHYRDRRSQIGAE